MMTAGHTTTHVSAREQRSQMGSVMGPTSQKNTTHSSGALVT